MRNNNKKSKSFDWDLGNLDKSYQKHGISPGEAEEAFLDDDLKTLEDFKHSEKEKRFIALGKTFLGKFLFAVYTYRKNKVRIISVRPMNKKERRYYEESLQKNTKI